MTEYFKTKGTNANTVTRTNTKRSAIANTSSSATPHTSAAPGTLTAQTEVEPTPASKASRELDAASNEYRKSTVRLVVKRYVTK